MIQNFSKFYVLARKNLSFQNFTHLKKHKDKYFIGTGIASFVYMVAYSIYDSKAIRVCYYPPIPKNTLSRDEKAIKTLKNSFFWDLKSNFFDINEKLPTLIFGNLGSGKSILTYQTLSEIYSKPKLYNFSLPKSQICAFLDMTSSDSFLESLRCFVYELNEKSKYLNDKPNLDVFLNDLISKPYIDQVSILIEHMYFILKHHSNWCIVLDNITPKSYNELKHIFDKYFGKNDMNGKFVFICDADFPLIENMYFFQYNNLDKQTCFDIIKNQLGNLNIQEKDFTDFINLLCCSPLALIAACNLIKVQLVTKKHITIKEAANIIASSISNLSDKISKKQNIDINVNNMSYILTMTTFAMLIKSLNKDLIIPYNYNYLSNMNNKEKEFQDSLILLNKTFEKTLNLFASLKIGTKIPITTLAYFLNKQVEEISDKNDYFKVLDKNLFENKRMFYQKNKVYSLYELCKNEYEIIKKEIKNTIYGIDLKSFKKPEEILNNYIEWIPFLRFSKYSEQRLISMHPYVHEASKLMIQLSMYEKELNNKNNEIKSKPKSKRFLSLNGFVSPKCNGNNIMIDEKLYEKLTFSYYNPKDILRLGNNDDIKFLNYLKSLIETVTYMIPLRFGDYEYNGLKQISIIQQIINLIYSENMSECFKNYFYLCTKKLCELLLQFDQPKVIIELYEKKLKNDQILFNLNLQDKTECLFWIQLYLAESYIKIGDFNKAVGILEKLWINIDPNKNITIFPKLSIYLIYISCLLYDKSFNNEENFKEQILSYLLLAYNYQFQNTLIQYPIYDENEAAFFIKIMLLFSDLCLKYKKVNYALKFAKDAETFNLNVLKSGLGKITTNYDQSIKNLMLKCYQFQGNEEMIQKFSKI